MDRALRNDRERLRWARRPSIPTARDPVLDAARDRALLERGAGGRRAPVRQGTHGARRVGRRREDGSRQGSPPLPRRLRVGHGPHCTSTPTRWTASSSPSAAIAARRRRREAEIAEADAIVRADPEIAQILRRQPDLSLQGGFPDESGAAARVRARERTRCLQMLLFDGDNVVRHMLVDLRTGSILERDYIPPRNRASAR